MATFFDGNGANHRNTRMTELLAGFRIFKKLEKKYESYSGRFDVMCSSNLLHYFDLESKLMNFSSDLAISSSYTTFGVGWFGCVGRNLNFLNHMFCS